MTNTEFAGVEMGNATDHKDNYDKDDVIWIGNTAVPARDVLTAWGGNMNIGLSKAPKVCFFPLPNLLFLFNLPPILSCSVDLTLYNIAHLPSLSNIQIFFFRVILQTLVPLVFVLSQQPLSFLV